MRGGRRRPPPPGEIRECSITLILPLFRTNQPPATAQKQAALRGLIGDFRQDIDHRSKSQSGAAAAARTRRLTSSNSCSAGAPTAFRQSRPPVRLSPSAMAFPRLHHARPAEPGRCPGAGGRGPAVPAEASIQKRGTSDGRLRGFGNDLQNRRTDRRASGAACCDTRSHRHGAGHERSGDPARASKSARSSRSQAAPSQQARAGKAHDLARAKAPIDRVDSMALIGDKAFDSDTENRSFGRDEGGQPPRRHRESRQPGPRPPGKSDRAQDVRLTAIRRQAHRHETLVLGRWSGVGFDLRIALWKYFWSTREQRPARACALSDAATRPRGAIREWEHKEGPYDEFS